MANTADPINILSLEDEPVIAARIQRFTTDILGNRLGQYIACGTVEEALREIQSREYSLFLLDLNLHGESGFELLKTSTSYAAQTIVISAYTDKAITAFDYGVIDFVAKPFDKDRLGLAFQRFFNTTEKQEREHYPKYLSFRSAGRTAIAPLEQVTYINGADKYSEVHLQNGDTKLHDKSLQQFEQFLPGDFERIHKSYIVKTDQIERFETEEGSRYYVVLKTGERLPVGRSRYKNIRERYI